MSDTSTPVRPSIDPAVTVRNEVFHVAIMVDGMLTCLTTLLDEAYRALDKSGFGSAFKPNHDAMQCVIDVLAGQARKLEEIAGLGEVEEG